MPLPDGDYEIQFGSGDRWAGMPAAHIDTFATLRIVPRSESLKVNVTNAGGDDYIMRLSSQTHFLSVNGNYVALDVSRVLPWTLEHDQAGDQYRISDSDGVKYWADSVTSNHASYFQGRGLCKILGLQAAIQPQRVVSLTKVNNIRARSERHYLSSAELLDPKSTDVIVFRHFVAPHLSALAPYGCQAMAQLDVPYLSSVGFGLTISTLAGSVGYISDSNNWFLRHLKRFNAQVLLSATYSRHISIARSFDDVPDQLVLLP
ncbi:hypothetical protein CTheo_7008 [Ceratobasidium theobromae]|uniref:Uncharacterized protein n=1 Tax=Ceratobasidium theobromae TaxID=1582974 RepID=A0A5N5QDL9_9AGAM|nr:hypothetical protein CTheo_7008 [Ceratobasidium theobromae]